jgi:hypothetical protein
VQALDSADQEQWLQADVAGRAVRAVFQ